ncbi:MAG TPA: hypothetical protein VHF24_05295 [Acidimicrobiales bacterium]|nr:hypothetical protein [Acidimicrobiales bacterium]
MLLLFPAAVLIVVVLAAIAVDGAIAFLGQREVANAVVAAANDAAGAGIADRAFYRESTVDLDPSAVAVLAEERVRTVLDPGRFHRLEVDVAVVRAAGACPPRVRVRASATVDTLFADALPGGARQTLVSAVATGSPRQDASPAC